MNLEKDKVADTSRPNKPNNLQYPPRDTRFSSHKQHSGILPNECPGPTLNTGAGSVGIPGCGKVRNKKVTDKDNITRSTLASFDASNMIEARMNSKNIPVGCQDTSMPHFHGSFAQHIPGAGSPQSEPHHIRAWNDISSYGTDNSDPNMMHPQAAPLDRYNEHMIRDEKFNSSTSSYTAHVRGSPADIPVASQDTEGKKNYEYGMKDQYTVPRNYAIDETNPSMNLSSTADPDILNLKNKVLHE